MVEVGLAYASSALAIGEALVTIDPPHPRHVVIDPFQESVWSNVGWELLRSAGLDAIATLVLAPSSIALAQLTAERFIADAAFVNGSHRFHEVFVDLYFESGGTNRGTPVKTTSTKERLRRHLSRGLCSRSARCVAKDIAIVLLVQRGEAGWLTGIASSQRTPPGRASMQ